MSSFIPLDKAEVKYSLKVCCKDMAEAVRDSVIKVESSILRKKSTVNGGPSFYELYNVVVSKDGNEVFTCKFCGKPITDKNFFITINYEEKNE